MNKQEMAQIITVMQTNYPDDFRNMSDVALRAKIQLWHTQFKDDSYQDVMAAVMAHIATDTGRFMPPVGVIKAKLAEIRLPENLTESEAWGIVLKAMVGASMSPSSRRFRDGVLDPLTSAERNFAEMPEIVQRIVGSPRQLAEWAAMEAETVQSVVASNFQRSYRIRAVKEREYLALPSEVRQTMDKIAAAMQPVALPEESQPEHDRNYWMKEVANYGK